MASARASARLRRHPGGILPLLLAASVSACAGRIPVLVPPAGGVEAVEGFASGAISGAEASVKGKFAFLFRRPGLGRVEAVDPIGRTAFVVHFRDGRAWFVLPSKKAYAEDDAEVVMERLLGIALRPDDTLALLSGTWPAAGPATAWSVGRDAQGRVAGGAKDGFAFEVTKFFRGGAAPREIVLAGPEASGRVKVLKLAFDPAPRAGAFDTAYLSRYAAKTWEGMLEILDR